MHKGLALDSTSNHFGKIRSLIVITLLLCFVYTGTRTERVLAASQTEVDVGTFPLNATRIASAAPVPKRLILGGACSTCPYGALAEIVKAAVDQYGYDTQVCYACGGGTRAVEIVEGTVAPPTDAGGRVDVGITAAQYVWWAYQGTHDFAQSKRPSTDLRLLAYLQSPSYLLVAARTGSGIRDLHQITQEKMPVKVVAATTSGISDVLAYYGISDDALRAWGGAVVRSTNPKDRTDADVIISFGALNNTPEHNIWYEQSQRQDLRYLQLPDDLIASVTSRYDLERGEIPEGFLRGIDRAIPAIVRTGIVLYCRAGLPAQLAYTITKALDVHQDLLQWDLMNVSYNANHVFTAYGLPLHEGAQRYYRERGYLSSGKSGSKMPALTK
jgi:TRAP-type uncharacterized transport system substrate-binding protein